MAYIDVEYFKWPIVATLAYFTLYYFWFYILARVKAKWGPIVPSSSSYCLSFNSIFIMATYHR